MDARRIAVVCAWIGALFFLVIGAWALAAPHSFYEVLAKYPPYHRHLFHDAGAFQFGLGVGIVAGLLGRRPLAVGLWAAATGATLHAVSHWVDHGLGGRSTDAPLLTIFAAVLVVGLIAAERRTT